MFFTHSVLSVSFSDTYFPPPTLKFWGSPGFFYLLTDCLTLCSLWFIILILITHARTCANTPSSQNSSAKQHESSCPAPSCIYPLGFHINNSNLNSICAKLNFPTDISPLGVQKLFGCTTFRNLGVSGTCQLFPLCHPTSTQSYTPDSFICEVSAWFILFSPT